MRWASGVFINVLCPFIICNDARFSSFSSSSFAFETPLEPRGKKQRAQMSEIHSHSMHVFI
jgi:hypothetical protein